MFYIYKMAPQRQAIEVRYYFFRYSELKFIQRENIKYLIPTQNLLKNEK
jgi:hypothetical protein